MACCTVKSVAQVTKAAARLKRAPGRRSGSSGASTVVLGDLGCMLNIEGRLRKEGDTQTRVLHIAEVLAEPIVRAVMKRDSVSEATLINVIENARHAIERHAA